MSNLISNLISIYALCFIIRVVMEILVRFNIIRGGNPIMTRFYSFLFKITEPVLSKVRALLPKSLEVDLSPLVVLLLLYFIQDVVAGLI